MLKRAQGGMSVVELMITLTIVAFLLMLAVPNFTTFLQNTQIRNAAETTLAGLNLARAEAVRRNTTVRFQLVSSLSGGCTLDATALNWVVSLADPTGACDVEPSDATPPQIVQKKSAREGSSNVTLTSTGGSTLMFSGLGRLSGAGITRLDFGNSAGTCEHTDSSGTMRCLSILVSTGGQARMCDPKVADATDPRHC